MFIEIPWPNIIRTTRNILYGDKFVIMKIYKEREKRIRIGLSLVQTEIVSFEINKEHFIDAKYYKKCVINCMLHEF